MLDSPPRAPASLGWRLSAVLPQISYLKNILLFIYSVNFWLHWAFMAARGLSLVAASGGCPLVVVPGLLTAVTSLVVGHRLQGAQALVVAVHTYSLPQGKWNFPRSEIEPMSPALAGGFLTTGPSRKSPRAS